MKKIAEKKTVKAKTFKIGDGVDDVLNFLDRATKKVMEIKDKGTSDERCVFIKETRIIVEFKTE